MAPSSLQQPIGIFATIEEIYPDLKSGRATLLALLAELSRDETLITCARINTFVTGPGVLTDKERQELALGFLCQPDDMRRINDFVRRHGGADHATIFFRGQLLELIRWATKYCQNLSGDRNIYANPEVKRRFIQAALIAGQLWGERTYSDRLTATAGTDDTARARAMGPFRKAVEESNPAPHLGVTLGRGWSLFTEYFPNRYPDFAAQFTNATRMSVAEYYTCVAGLMSYTVCNKSDGPLFRDQVGAATAYSGVFPNYLGLESQNPDSLASTLWTDLGHGAYHSIRDRPILLIDNQASIILDPTYYSDKLSVGPLFHLITANPQLANEIFGKFGLAFEDYVIDTLKRMYPERPGLVSRMLYNVSGKDKSGRPFEIDAAQHDVTALIIAEIKASWLREDTILDDYEALIRQLRLRYGVNLDSTGATEGKPKGVAQLSRIIGAISRGDWGGPNGQFSDATIIYPVLLVHDKRMDAPGTGNFLANEFRRLLGTDGLKIRVAPLTMMTIEDLENLESSINAFSMRQLLFDYTNDVPHGLLSLRNYIARSAYAEKLKPSPFLRTKSEELLIHARKVLFPNTEIRIRERAYMLWAQQGRPDGKHLEHWLQAETEIEADKTSEEIA